MGGGNASFRPLQDQGTFAQSAFHRAAVGNENRNARKQEHAKGADQAPEQAVPGARENDRDDLKDDA